MHWPQSAHGPRQIGLLVMPGEVLSSHPVNRKSQYVQCTEVYMHVTRRRGVEENKSEVMKRMGGTSGMDKRNRGAGKEDRKKERERKNSSTLL